MAFNISGRAVVDLQEMVFLKVQDLGRKIEAMGTVVDRPRGALHNMQIDEPLAPGDSTHDFIGGNNLRAVSI